MDTVDTLIDSTPSAAHAFADPLTPIDETLRVLPAEPGWTGRLDVGNPEMLTELAAISAANSGPPSM